MSEVKELFTAMDCGWSDEQCIKLAADNTKEYAPWRDTVQDIQTDQMDSKVVKITIEVLDQPLSDLLADKQHRD